MRLAPILVALVLANFAGASAKADTLDCYPRCTLPGAAFQIADSTSEWRAKRDADQEARRLIEAKRRDRSDREALANKKLRKLKDALNDG